MSIANQYQPAQNGIAARAIELKVVPALRVVIPPLSAEEREGLEADIIKNGCRDPLVVWDGKLVDGHNRYDICQSHGLPFATVDMDFESEAHARIWMRSNQSHRRNLTDAWKIELQLANKADLANIGQVKREATQGRPLKQDTDKLLSNIDNSFPEKAGPKHKKHNTRKAIADASGQSEGKVGQAEYVKKNAPDLWEEAKAGDRTIGNAYAEVKKQEKKAERERLIETQREEISSGAIESPTGLYDVVAMDPPWNYGRKYDPDSSRVANPYPEMTQAELLAMEPPFADSCVLFLWTTHQFIWDAKALADRWGFEYKATLVWDKEKIGMGSWLRMQCEFCLVCIKGKPLWDNTTWRDVIREARREHSRKPEAFYQMVESVTVGRRLDYFSREQRDGWVSFGNDTGRFQ